MTRPSLIVGLAVLFVAASCGGTRQLCTPASCAQGCCDPVGECHLGVLESACGSEGAGCSVCAFGSKCSAHACWFPDGGMAGTGGGVGGGGGAGGVGGGKGEGRYPTDGGCWQISTFVEEHSLGGWGFDRFVYEDRGMDPNVDFLLLNTYQGAVPGTQDLSVKTPGVDGYTVWFLEDCTRAVINQFPIFQNCAHAYKSVSGLMTVSSVSGDRNMGRWAGSVTGVHLREWITDAGYPYFLGPRCIDLASETVDVTYP